MSVCERHSGIQRIEVELVWDPNLSRAGHAYDLDVSAFLLGTHGKAPTERHFVYYRNRESPDGAVKCVRENRVGGDPPETMTLDLDRVADEVRQVVLCVSIHQALARAQTFGAIPNAVVVIREGVTRVELCRYELSEDFSGVNAVEVARLSRGEQGWRLVAIGSGHRGELRAYVDQYI